MALYAICMLEKEPRKPAKRGALTGDRAVADALLRKIASHDQQRRGPIQTEVDRTSRRENVEQN